MTNTKSPLHKTDPIITADHYQLGQAVRLYHRQNEIDPDEELFPHYLMVANLSIGDEYYIPLHYLTAYNPQTGAHTLNLTLQDVSDQQLSSLPHFIAFNQALEEDLPQPPPTDPAPK